MHFSKTSTVLTAAVLGLGMVSSSAIAAGKITFVSWGGAYTASQVKACIEPYQAATGQEFNIVDYNGGLAEVRTQVEADNVQWDIIDQTPQDAVRGCDEGLYVELDHSKWQPAADGTPATEDFVDGALGDCYVGNISWATVPAYDKTKVKGTPPSTMADFWDLKKYPGRRGLRKTPRVNLEWALMADGVANDKIYEMLGTDAGVKRAFKKLDEIKDDVVWWEAGAQPPQMLADGEVVMTTAYNGRLFNAMYKEGKPFEIMWGPQVFDIDTYVVVKGAPQEKAAMDFLKFCTSAEALADTTNYISYGPLRKSSAAFVNPDILPHLPTAPDNFKTALTYNIDFWADNADDLQERFNSWLVR
jgi:putative spermidine/putrescine transport system substrate-binding protein